MSGAESYLEQRQQCLDHARDLIASAKRVLAGESAYPNVAYHLAVLALEELGKAGMLCARGVARGRQDTTWIDKRLDSHVWKLMWAVWAPGLSGGKIDPAAFEEARRFAQSTHNRRMAGLYVDFEGVTTAPPRQAVRIDHATSVMNLAAAHLELEEARGPPMLEGDPDDLEWYFATVSDELAQKRLFSQAFLKRHQELDGDTRTWVRWAREEFRKEQEAEREVLKRELSREASKPGEGKPKWLVKVRLRVPSHSLRQKTLNFWNERIDAVKLRTAGPNNQDLLLEITVHDHIKLEQLFDFGLALSKMYAVMLNIGTAGFVWYELPANAEAYYESVQDLERPRMKVVMERRSALLREWTAEGLDGGKRQRAAMEEVHLATAIRALAAFGSMRDQEAEPIFGHYLKGLTLLGKADLHLSLETQARDAFVTALRSAMHRFGDLESVDGPLVEALHRVVEPIINEEAHRTMVFGQLEIPGKASMHEALAAKRAADLYLAIVAHRLWPNFMQRAESYMTSSESRADGEKT